MQIVCSTAAAARVLRIPLAARLLPRHDYEIHQTISSTPPVTFTVLSMMPAVKLVQIHAFADTTVTQ
jgi:hypothetical protein